MSRHRIVRTMDYKDEYDGYDDIYGHSVDDDNCISPTDASQWIYDRARGQQSMSAFIANHRNIEEENEDEEDDPTATGYMKVRRDSENFQMPVLDDIEQAKLMSCIDEIRSVVGDSISERQIVETAMKFDYDVPKTLDAVLNASSNSQQVDKSTTKPSKDPSHEKDFVSKFSKDNIKPISDSVGSSTSNKLIELSKINLQNLKISKSPGNSGFVVPKLNFPSSSDNNRSGPSKLNQFINDQLNRSATLPASGLGNIILPKLGNSSSLDATDSKTTLTPLQLSLRKIKESKLSKSQSPEAVCSKLKNLTIMEDEFDFETQSCKVNEETLIIDLTKALSDITSSPRTDPSITQSKEEIFVIPFIDCDGRYLKKSVTSAVRKNVKRSGLKQKTKPTNFGRIICLKYHCTQMPQIKHTFESNYSLIPFNFETKSPDDIVLEKQKRAFEKSK